MIAYAQGKLATLMFWPRPLNPWPWWMTRQRLAWFAGWDSVSMDAWRLERHG